MVYCTVICYIVFYCRCYTMLCYVVRGYIIKLLFLMMIYSTLKYLLYYTILHCTMLYCTLIHYDVLHCALLSYVIVFNARRFRFLVAALTEWSCMYAKLVLEKGTWQFVETAPLLSIRGARRELAMRIVMKGARNPLNSRLG